MFQYVKRIVLYISLYLAGSATEASSIASRFTPNPVIEQNIHWVLFYLFSVVTGILFVVLICCLIKNRQTKGTHFHPHLALELIWTMLPLVILVALAIPAVIQFIHSHG